MLFYQENFVIKNMTEELNKKLETIIDLLNKILDKQNSVISFGNYEKIKSSFKESNFPTPWNSSYIKPNKEEDELYD